MARTTTAPVAPVIAGIGVADALAAYAADPTMAAVQISDTAATIAANFDALRPLAAAGKITAIAVSDGAAVTIAYAAYTNDAAVVALMAASTLAVLGASTAQATALQAKSQVKSFTVTGSSAEVSAALNALNAATKLTSVVLTDTAPLTMTYTQYTADKTVLAKLPSSAKYVVSAVTGSAASGVQSNAAVLSFTVTDTASRISAVLDTLNAATKLTTIALTDTAAVAMTYTQYLNDKTVLAKLPATATYAVSAVTVANAAAMQVAAKVASFAISDTVAAVSAALDALNADTRLSSIKLTNSGSVTMTYTQYTNDKFVLGKLASTVKYAVSGVSVANAAALQSNAKVATFAVVDGSAQVSAALNALNADTKLTTIALTDSGPITMTYTQYGADKTVLAKLPKTATYAVSAVPAANAATLQANALVGSFAVSDTSANIATNLAGIAGSTKMTSFDVTGGSVLTIDYARYQSYAAVLGKLNAADTVTVTGVPAAAATTVAADARVTHLSVSDTLANVGTSLDLLQTLAASGELTVIAVTDSGQTLTMTDGRYAADSAAIGLMTGTFTIDRLQAPEVITGRPPVINLVWDSSVAQAPAGFKTAVEYAAHYFDSLITNPITINLRVGYGDVRGAALGSGLLGEAYIDSGVFLTFDQYKASLAAHNTSGAIQTALDNLTAPAGGSVFVPGAQAKALGAIAGDATAIDGSVGFAADPYGTMFSYDPNNRAVDGKFDFIGLAEHEIFHALGRVSYGSLPTALDLYRYSAPHVPAVAGTGASYFSIDGGVTNLGDFAVAGDIADWGTTMGNDVSNALLSTGIGYSFSDTDRTLLNTLGFAIDTAAAPSSAVLLSSTTISPSIGLGSAASPEFVAPAPAPEPEQTPLADLLDAVQQGVCDSASDWIDRIGGGIDIPNDSVAKSLLGMLGDLGTRLPALDMLGRG